MFKKVNFRRYTLGEDMISPELDFRQFLEATKKKDVYETIYLADQEAIAAWRRSYRSNGSSKADDQQSTDYQNKLKRFIYHLRSSVRQSELGNPKLKVPTSRNQKN